MDTYSTAVLLGVLQSLENAPVTFFRDRFFTTEVRSDREEILFDVIDKKRRLAPFVSPLVRGKLMESRGYSTRMFKPAYVKPKSVIKPTDAIKRLPGEQLAGSLTMGQRRNIHIRNAIQEHEEAITMREEVMAVEAVRLGQVTVTGEGYGTVVVQFGRDVELREVLTAGSAWNDMTIGEIFDWLEERTTLVRQKSGGSLVRDVILGTEAWGVFRQKLRSDADLLNILLNSANRGQTTSAQVGPQTAEKSRFEGRIGDYNFWTYSDTYQDEDGNEVEVFPADEVLLASPDIEGHRVYGAIHDPRAGLAPLPRFPKNWIVEDPPMELVMTQSAPLMVPLRPNASFSAVVTVDSGYGS